MEPMKPMAPMTPMEPMKPMAPMRPMMPMEPLRFERWWPDEFGQPSTAGGQNGLRYAVFPEARRLLVERDGALTTYDTGDHRIGGVSSQQQNGGAASLSFSSQHGPLRLEELPVVNGDSADGGTAARRAEPGPAHSHQAHRHPHAGREPARGHAQVEPERHRPSRHDDDAREGGGDDRPAPPRAVVGERVVFSEEGGPTRAIRLLVRGEMDVDLIEAVEDFLRRQKRRLTRG